LPILDGDQLIGRIDPVMDRARGVLTLNAIYAERAAPKTRETTRAIADAITRLAEFLGAQQIVYPRRVPRGWEGVRK